ncbi:MAG: ATP synthase F0 subunit B [Alphaproteobacteria bacterium]|nr:ATP synthase F0 subunit B [Alphaproteobacteria bacterium]
MDIIPDPTFAAAMTVPFIVAALALYGLLFKPYFDYLEGREGAIEGARHEAQGLARDSEAKLAQVHAALADARRKAEGVRAERREAGLAYERGVVEDARAAAEKTIEEALATIGTEADAASEALRQTAGELSSDIATRVLGRGEAA